MPALESGTVLSVPEGDDDDLADWEAAADEAEEAMDATPASLFDEYKRALNDVETKEEILAIAEGINKDSSQGRLTDAEVESLRNIFRQRRLKK